MDHKISVPKPCHEDWNAMTPNEQGRFCGQCAKTVTDFTGMGAMEIQNYLLENSGKKVCGRFKPAQLDAVTVTIPERALYMQTRFRNIFLLALLVTMGTTLFSCKKKDQIIGEIAIATDSIVVDSTEAERVPMHTLGIIREPDSLPPPPQPDKAVKGKVKCSQSAMPTKEVTGAVAIKPVPQDKHMILGEVAPITNDSVTPLPTMKE